MEFMYIGYFLIFIVLLIILVWPFPRTESFENPEYTNDTAYKKQLEYLSQYNSSSDAKRPVTELISKGVNSTSFVNFFALGCRYTGYMGPFENGYFDPDIATQAAVKAGCRVFVLDIDYINSCDGYFPRLVVRDVKERLQINPASNKPFCENIDSSSIMKVCDKINTYAFSEACQNASDPVILVLYFVNQPDEPHSKKSLDYFSKVAKALKPLRNRILKNELRGGNFFRQMQESNLLIGDITDYNKKVIIFSNANTSGFRKNSSYPLEDDLDYQIHMRLSYSQTRMGVTEKDATMGILQAAEDFTAIPKDRSSQVTQFTKSHWTIALPQDPGNPVTKEVFQQLITTFGVHCIPGNIFDESSAYLFKDNLFQTYSFLPKPVPLQYIKPPVVVPAEPNPANNANGGQLRSPT